MSKDIIIHFSQDFTYGKPQLGGYGRILNTFDTAQRHILYTPSREGNLEQKNFLVNDEFEVRQVPGTVSTRGFLSRLKSVNNIAEFIVNDLKIEGLEPSIFFGHSQLSNFYILSKVRKGLKLKIPLVWEFNAIWGGIGVNSLKNRLAISLIRYFEREIVKSADGLIFQTTASQAFMTKLYGCSRGKQLVVTNAVTACSLVDRDFSRKLSAPPKVLVNGLFDSMNGAGVIVDYLTKNLHPPVELHFYGLGPWAEQLRALSDNKRVVFHGSVSHDEMQRVYANFDYHLIPRLKCVEAELFIPSKLLEAMGNGLVPIVTDVGGLTEVVGIEEGFVVEAGNSAALEEIFNHIKNQGFDEWQKRSVKCREKVESQFIWGENHKKLRDLYRRIC